MNEGAASQAIKILLTGLGVRSGETIYLGLDMSRLPLPRWPAALSREGIRAREERWCAFLFEQIMDMLGPEGTLLVGTFTYSCANPNVPFVLEETPSELGPFTNWLRQHTAAIRSLHPVFSVAGVGAHASDILSHAGAAAFGPCSPFGRLAAHSGRFVNLGIPFRQSLSYVHHLEQCYGCNHRYNRVFQGPVYENDRRVDREFLGYMRWRGIDASVNVGPLEDELKRSGLLLEVDTSGVFGQSALVTDIDQIGYAMLTKSACAFSSRNVRIDLDDGAVSSNRSGSPIVVFKLSM